MCVCAGFCGGWGGGVDFQGFTGFLGLWGFEGFVRLFNGFLKGVCLVFVAGFFGLYRGFLFGAFKGVKGFNTLGTFVRFRRLGASRKSAQRLPGTQRVEGGWRGSSSQLYGC